MKNLTPPMNMVLNASALFILLTCTPLLSHAATFWEDGFESGNTGYNLVGGMSYDSGRVRSGARSLRQTFLGNHIQGGTFTDRTFSKTEELWSRFYFYFPSSFQVDAQSQTKMMLQGEECCYPSYWWGMLFGAPNLTVQVQGIVLPNGSLDTINLYGAEIPRDQWVCIETHIKNNTPGAANGIVQAWMNGVLALDRNDIAMRAATFNQNNSPTAGFTLNRLYVQYGGPGDLNYDDIAVGNTRIGCPGGNTQNTDTTPPLPPSGFTAR